MSKLMKRHEFTEADAAQLDPKLVEAVAADRYFACETLFKVADKDGKLVPCKIRPLIQQHYEASGEISLWLKSRQEFLTTSIDCLFYQDAVDLDGMKVLGLNLTEKKAQENFARVLCFEDNRHPILKELTVGSRTAEELSYVETRSIIKSLTIKNDSTEAQAELAGRTGTYHRARLTEAAFMRHYAVAKKAMLDTMPRGNRKFVAETTGNGAVGGFYDDFMAVVTHGQPHPTVPNCWVLGNTTAHFLAWFQHHEYVQAASPFSPESLNPDTARILREHEADHIVEMRHAGLSPEDIEKRLNWRRAGLMEKGLLTDPAGACKNMNREYPGNYRHAFQSTGQAWFNLSLIDQLREFYKTQNEREGLPVYLDFIHEKGKMPEPTAGQKFMVWEMPERGFQNRYCGFLDPSAGHEGGDAAAFFILDRHLLRIAAAFHGAYEPRVASRMMMTLGAWYDYAFLNWENDGLGLAVTEALIEGKYTNLYKGEPDRVDLGAYGWYTGPESRSVMVTRGKTYFEHPRTPIRCPYVPFYGEAASFQVPPGKSKPVAMSGHDDLVMAFCGVVMTHLAMPDIVRPRREHTMKPGEAAVSSLAGITQGYRQAAQRRAAGFSNYGSGR
jgi:hypothetical protein